MNERSAKVSQGMASREAADAYLDLESPPHRLTP